MKNNDNKNNINYYANIKDKSNKNGWSYNTKEKYYYDNPLEDNEFEIKVRTQKDYLRSDQSEVIKINARKKDKNDIKMVILSIFGNSINGIIEFKTHTSINEKTELFCNNNNNKNQTSILFENNIYKKNDICQQQ